MGKFENKVVLITGGTTGIGLATAQAFSREGAKVAITGRSQANLDKAEAAIGGEVLAIRADASDLGDVDRMLEQTASRFGRIDVLFLNAGPGGVHAPVEEVTEEAFDGFCNTNFKGPFFTIQKALPRLADNASIIFCSSISNAIGQTGLGVYAGAKAAQRALARVLATELGPRGIRVNVVSPGFIDTPILAKSGVPEPAIAGIHKMVEGATKLGRMGKPEDIAGAVLYLASPEAAYVIGEEIVVDGGYTIVT